jgi:anti-sigma B factor antagonist
MSLDVETFTMSGLNFVKLRGSLTSGMSLATAEAKIKSVIEGGAKRLILDISLVTYADSSGLGMLVHVFGLAEKAQCKLRIAGANEKIGALMNTTRLDTILALDPDAEVSLAKLLQTPANTT